MAVKWQVIIGSTRPERVTDRLAKWVAAEAGQYKDVEVELLDLLEFDLPFLDEARSPQYNPDRKPTPNVKKWLDAISRADAFILVTPEYNRSTSGALKNALDFIDFQFEKKPVALVAHGSTGGAQAVGHLRGIIPGLQTVTVPTATFFIGPVSSKIDEKGTLDKASQDDPYGPKAGLQRMFNQLFWYTAAFNTARAQD